MEEEAGGRGRSDAAAVHVDVVPLVIVLGVAVSRRIWNRTHQNESKEFWSVFHQQQPVVHERAEHTKVPLGWLKRDKVPSSVAVCALQSVHATDSGSSRLL